MKPTWMQPMSDWKMGKLQSFAKSLPGFRRKDCKADEDRNDEQYQRLPSWQELCVDFVNRTTWHGLKYIAIPSRFLMRRIIWIMILLSNAVLFIYIMTTRKDHLMSHPSTVTVEVSYKDVLPFSAITICNHNQYRLTAMQENGLYDLLVNDMNNNADDNKACGYFQFYPGICRIPNEFLRSPRDKNIVRLNETTRSVCLRVCKDAYDWYCSGFLYNRRTRSCILSPYTGEWYEANQPPCDPSNGLEFYRRNRCTFDDNIHCNFEDLRCNFTNDPTQKDQWQIVEATGHKVHMDNTLDLPSGHVANLLLTELRPGYAARFQSPYINTTGKCIQFFYWLQVNNALTSESATLSVILISEEREEMVLLKLSKGPKDWSRQFVRLPAGVYQVMIEGMRGFVGQSGISLDDIVVQECNEFDIYRNCKVTRRGRAYMGSMNVTAAGESCIPWQSLSSPLLNRLPDDNQASAENHCRNIPQQNWDEPSCFVETKSLTIRAMPCDIPYCNCLDSSYFKCDNGMCLPNKLTCNGFDDCLDGSDEYNVCNNSRNIECLFDTDYKCGYESKNVGALFFRRVSASDLLYDYGASVFSTNVSALEQLMLVDSKLGQLGDQVQLVSPLWTFDRPTLLRLTYIMMGSSSQPLNSKAGLYLYQYSKLHVPVRQLFNATSFSARDLQDSEVCVPQGTYHLMFLGVQGIPYKSDFALDIVKIVGDCSFEEIAEDASFNCNFMTMCGYRFISSSALFTPSVIYTSNAFMQSNPLKVCSGVFGEVDGVITSPGYPNNYENNLSCHFVIKEPEGVTIIVTFLEFSLEPESDCLFDRLEIHDPVVNRTKIYCGDNDLPPVFQSKGNVLNFLFVTDYSVNNGRFKLGYRTPISPARGTDFSLALRYSGLRPSPDFIHLAKLMSPPIVLKSNSCITIVLMAAANFTVKMAFLRKDTYTERLLVSSRQPLGGFWHRLHLNVSPWMTDNQQFIMVFETAAAMSGTDASIINSIKLLDGSCRSAVTSGSLSCNFTEDDQCGYLDASKNAVQWLRVFDYTSGTYFMQSFFDPLQPEEAVLQSVESRVEMESCLKITYYSSSRDINIRIDSSPSSFLLKTDANRTTLGQLSFGNAYVEQDLPIGSYFIIIRAFLQGESLSEAVEEMKIYSIDILKTKCSFSDTVVNPYCTFNNPNLCGYTVNYPCGSPWTWSKFENLESDDVSKNSSHDGHLNHDRVMFYNGSSSTHPLKGVLLTSNLVKQSSQLMIIEAYTTSVNDTSIEMYAESTWGLSYSKLSVDGNLIQNQWTNLSICLPAGSFRVMILATAAPINFVAIDNVFLSSSLCTLYRPVLSVCTEVDLSNCQDYHFSWSPQFEWKYTADIRNNTIMPGGDGCDRVFYETEGVIVHDVLGKQYMNTTTCDIYIKGLVPFVISMWFEEIEIGNCSYQYLEIWRQDGYTFTNDDKVWCSDLQNYSTNPLVFKTNKIVQIRVFSVDGFPRFRIRYKYIPETMAGLFLALHYTDTKVSGTYTINRVAQWASVAANPTSNVVCLKLDMAFPFSLLEVVFLQNDVTDKLTVAKTVLERMGTTDEYISWAHGTFEIPVETNWTNWVQFVFYVSVVNMSFVNNSKTFVGALNKIFIQNGSCSDPAATMSVPSFCQFSRNDFCGYKDNSKDSSRWVLISRRATYSNSGNCKVSRDGREYMGNISNTISGRPCQRWDQQVPHRHIQDVADYFPDLTLDDAADHCRNPSNPFIIRSSWCYTMDQKQRREYCDIPFCLDYVMEAQFLSGRANRAVLVSPHFRLARQACLRFRFQLTSTLVELTVKRLTSSSNIAETVRAFGIPMEPTTYVWEDGVVDLASDTTQIQFVADKIDFTDFDQFVSLDNISVTEGHCWKSGKNASISPKEMNKIPYNGPRESRDSYRSLVLKDVEDADMQVLTSRMAHQLPQLIHKCDYDQHPCTETDFLTEFTDMGQCYTFNYDPDNSRKVYTTGAESGARFILNVEQYEHVKNYVSGVGVKMHLHDQTDISSMRDVGLAALPGVHNLATISYTQTESLPPPFGTCGSTSLPYFDIGNTTTTYTETKCRMESKTQYVEEICKCKDINMPGPSPVCLLSQHITCIKNVTGSSLNISSSAVCPEACSVNSFTLGLSQSQLSGLDIGTLLGNKTEDLRDHYVRALEIRHRVDEDLMTNTVKQIESLINCHVKLKDYIYFAVLDRGTSIPRHVEAALDTMSQLVVDDIVRGGDSLLYNFEAAYSTIMKPRESYLRESIVTLHAKLSLSKDLFRDINDALDQKWHEEVFNTTFLQLQEFGKTLVTYIQNTDITDDYQPTVFALPPCKTYSDAVATENARLIQLVENFSIFHDEKNCLTCSKIIRKIDRMLLSLSNVSNCNAEYSGFLHEFRHWIGSVSFDFKKFSNSINSEQVLNMFMHNEDWLVALKRNYTENAISKLWLAEQLLSDTSEQLSQQIDNVIQDISQQIVVPLQNKITSSEENIAASYLTFLTYFAKLANYTQNDNIEKYARTLDIWRKPTPNLEVPEMLEFALSSSETWQVWPSEQTMASFVLDGAKDRLSLVSMVYFSQLNRQLTSFLTEVKAYQTELTLSFETVKQSLTLYKDSTKIDDEFVMQNFLMLDVYYGEMKYEHISQSESYTWTNFFSDLGSYFGLLMGCSLLTMIEVLDLVIYYAIVKIIEKYQAAPHLREVIEVNNIDTTHM